VVDKLQKYDIRSLVN